MKRQRCVRYLCFLLGSSVAVGLMVFLWPNRPDPFDGAPLLSLVVVPADFKVSTLKGVSANGRYVLATWMHVNKWKGDIYYAEGRQPIDNTQDRFGFEIWDRAKGTRKRWGSIEEVYLHPSGNVMIVQKQLHSAFVYQLAPDSDRPVKVFEQPLDKPIFVEPEGQLVPTQDGGFAVYDETKRSPGAKIDIEGDFRLGWANVIKDRGIVACLCTRPSWQDKVKRIQVYDSRSGKLLWKVRETTGTPADILGTPLVLPDGSGLVFLVQQGDDVRLESWQIPADIVKP